MSTPALRTTNWCALEVKSGRAGCLPYLKIMGDVEAAVDGADPFLCEIVSGDVEPGTLLLNLKGMDGGALGVEMRSVRFKKVTPTRRYAHVLVVRDGAPIVRMDVARADHLPGPQRLG
ncbi:MULTISPECIES: hypothetical protein [Methylobacterium]|uniref:Uncharacterized protein n=2 Tax=Methylobacterium TaxID=407 RepID=A0A0C6F7I7_9HYPH|nr:hypothetical protein [Methylobacterium aquaticum]BAQ44258.1 hypothetical protein Maq22A_c04165 [Methylobacterium aquaticum]